MKIIKYFSGDTIRESKIDDYLCECYEKFKNIYYITNYDFNYNESYCIKETIIFDKNEPTDEILNYFKKYKDSELCYLSKLTVVNGELEEDNFMMYENGKLKIYI